MKKMKKTIELTYEEVGILLDLALMSNAETSDEPTARLLANLGDLYRQFSGEKNLAWLVENSVCEVQAT